jgi:hypothetical protein
MDRGTALPKTFIMVKQNHLSVFVIRSSVCVCVWLSPSSQQGRGRQWHPKCAVCAKWIDSWIWRHFERSFGFSVIPSRQFKTLTMIQTKLLLLLLLLIIDCRIESNERLE